MPGPACHVTEGRFCIEQAVGSGFGHPEDLAIQLPGIQLSVACHSFNNQCLQNDLFSLERMSEACFRKRFNKL